MFYEAYVEKLINFVIPNVEFLQLFKCLDTLDVFELTSANVEKSYIFKGGADVTETRNN